jgi:hypothetical protein
MLWCAGEDESATVRHRGVLQSTPVANVHDRYSGPEQFVIVEIDGPEIGDDDVLVR